MPGALKVVTYTVRASLAQSVAWRRASDADGHTSVGGWLAQAADAFLEARARAGRPLPLAWRRGCFRVTLEGGALLTVRGFVSPPFGAFRGTVEGPGVMGCHRYTLVHTPAARLLATLRTYQQCRTLASELAPLLFRDERAAALVTERHSREAF